MEVRTLDSSFHELRINYEQVKDCPIGKGIHCNAFCAGGYMWRINCYPRGSRELDEQGKHLAIYGKLMSKTRGVNAIFEALLVDKGGQTSATAARTNVHLFHA
jgi:speckle-type POZ protein